MCLWKVEYIKNLLMQSHSYFHLPATLLIILTVLTLAKSVSIYKWSAKINCIWLQYIALKKESLPIRAPRSFLYSIHTCTEFRKLLFPSSLLLPIPKGGQKNMPIIRNPWTRFMLAFQVGKALLTASFTTSELPWWFQWVIISHNNYSEHLYYRPT